MKRFEDVRVLEYFDPERRLTADNFDDMINQMTRKKKSKWKDFGRWARDVWRKSRQVQGREFVTLGRVGILV